ncbi:MAG: DUF1127 domain-containing protein [Maritimibacter sp.]|nr:DUF1127 domain-containing protein [Maritimibacter sp.]
MTTITTNTLPAERRPSILSRIGDFFVAYAESQGRYHEIARLQALSDEELAARGLTRDGIVRHVFADKLYL